MRLLFPLILLGCPKPAPLPSAPADCAAPTGEEGQAWFSAIEKHAWLAFAQQTFGPIQGCTASYEPGADGLSASAEFRFAGGATFRVEHSPPETTVQELRVPAGFPEVTAGTALLRAHESGDWAYETVDWEHPQMEEAEPGEQARVYWSAEEGMNLSLREIYRGEQLVAIRMSMAL
jgi:hypothetical protein